MNFLYQKCRSFIKSGRKKRLFHIKIWIAEITEIARSPYEITRKIRIFFLSRFFSGFFFSWLIFMKRKTATAIETRNSIVREIIQGSDKSGQQARSQRFLSSTRRIRHKAYPRRFRLRRRLSRGRILRQFSASQKASA